jgi:hypothetical protein
MNKISLLSLVSLISLCPVLSWTAAEPTVNLEGLEYTIMESTPTSDGFLKNRITRIERSEYVDLYCYSTADGQTLFRENSEHPGFFSFFTRIANQWHLQPGLWKISERDAKISISRIR